MTTIVRAACAPGTGNTVVCTGSSDLVLNGSVSYVIASDADASIANTSILTNSVSVDGVDQIRRAETTRSEDTTVITRADLSITKSDSPDPVIAGTNLTYTMTVDSDGPSDALNVSVSDTMPAGTTFVSATGGGSYDAGTNTVTWSLGTVAASDAADV